MSRFFCPVCGNKDPKFIGYLNGKPYCRRCISFCGEKADEHFIVNDKIESSLDYPLTEKQQAISDEIIENYKKHFNQLLYAVCGAGKTELVFGVIEYALQNKLRVGFAIPRRDVVIELAMRIKSAFKSAKVVSLYGGNTDEIEGDIICLTTHQLFRFDHYFDLLILDELDAFPYKENVVLQNIFLRSVRGNYLLMSATPSEELVNEFKSSEDKKMLNLFVRFHGKPIPVPNIIIIHFDVFKLIYIALKLRSYLKVQKKVLIFVPTISLAKKVYNFLKNLAKPGYFLSSQSKNRLEIIQDFRKNKYEYLVTTAVLERGVTLRNLQVIIYKADEEIYNSQALVQISGRVGRKADCPYGDVIYVASRKTVEMEKSINQIIEANRHL
ncbi:MAG: helicase-related protein [Candidatus Onthovivens sp.]|nr:helicase-related protein [Candidatus Onthovivens sp.]